MLPTLPESSFLTLLSSWMSWLFAPRPRETAGQAFRTHVAIGSNRWRRALIPGRTGCVTEEEAIP